MVYRDTSLDKTLSRRVNVTGSERYVLIDDLDTRINYSIYFEQYGGCAKNQTSEPVFVVMGENGKKCYSCALVQYAFALFLEGGGAERSSSLLSFFSLIAFPAPIPFFLTFLPLSLFLYLNITHCCVFPPISPVSHPSRIPTPPSLSSSAPYSSRHRSSRAPRPCPPPLFSFLNFFFQTCCGEQAFHLGEVVIIKFFLLMAVTAYLQQFSLFKHAFVFQIL